MTMSREIAKYIVLIFLSQCVSAISDTTNFRTKHVSSPLTLHDVLNVKEKRLVKTTVDEEDGNGPNIKHISDSNSRTAVESGGDDISVRETKYFQESGLKAHNILRAIHGASAMTIDSDLSRDAELYAKELAELANIKYAILSQDQGWYDKELDKLEKIQNSKAEDVGQNVAMRCSPRENYKFSAAEATKEWYGEVCEPGFKFGTEEPRPRTGHFTQVVWKRSTRLGIGKATSKEHGLYCTYIVSRYKDAGNGDGKYQENVLKGSFTNDICVKLEDIFVKIPPGINENKEDKKKVSGSSDSGTANNGGAKAGSSASISAPFDVNGLQAHNILREIHESRDIKLNRTL